MNVEELIIIIYSKLLKKILEYQMEVEKFYKPYLYTGAHTASC